MYELGWNQAFWILVLTSKPLGPVIMRVRKKAEGKGKKQKNVRKITKEPKMKFLLWISLITCSIVSCTTSEETDYVLLSHELDSLIDIHEGIGLYNRDGVLYFGIHSQAIGYSSVVGLNSSNTYFLEDSISIQQLSIFRKYFGGEDSATFDLKKAKQQAEIVLNKIIRVNVRNGILGSACDNPTTDYNCEFWMKGGVKGYYLKDSSFYNRVNRNDCVFYSFPWIFVKQHSSS